MFKIDFSSLLSTLIVAHRPEELKIQLEEDTQRNISFSSSQNTYTIKELSFEMGAEGEENSKSPLLGRDSSNDTNA